ncbi:MAG: DUF4412 domain-containing protein [Verrucomicrobiota bacterium]|nr:DUF4412 domain-containing protein [Verrucomicrobiota bacterium]
MKKLLIRSVFLLGSFVLGSLAQAQMIGGSSSGMSTAMLKLFGKTTAFTAQADVRILDAAQKESTTLTMSTALLEGKMRAEVDLNKMKSAQLPPDAIGQMKQMGLDKMVTVVRPDKKLTYLIYPLSKAYVEMPMSKEEAAESKMTTSVLGQETLDGHPCVKNKVTLTNEKGKKQEMTVWNASDLKDFPIKMQMVEEGNNITMQYKDIKFAKLDAKQFEPPAGFTKYENVQKLMMQKMTGQ